MPGVPDGTMFFIGCRSYDSLDRSPPARSERFIEPDQSDLGRPVTFAKIFPFPSDPNHLYILRRPGPHKGAFRDRHERRAGDAVDAGSAFDERR